MPPRRSTRLHSLAEKASSLSYKPKRERNVFSKKSLMVFETEVIACEEHVTCKYVGKKEMLAMLERVQEEAKSVFKAVSSEMIGVFVEGVGIIGDIIGNSEIWTESECRYCWIEDILLSDARYPWIVCLRSMGESEAYARSMNFLKSVDEDMKAYNNWVEDVLSKGANAC